MQMQKTLSWTTFRAVLVAQNTPIWFIIIDSDFLLETFVN